MQIYINKIRDIIQAAKDCGKEIDSGFMLCEWANNAESDSIRQQRTRLICNALFDALDTLERIKDLAKGI